MANVPGLMVIGAYDSVYPSYQAHGDFIDRRDDMAGRVAQQIDWTGHVATNPDTTFAFLDQVYRMRYPQGQLPSLVAGNPLPLVDIPLSSGWLGEVNGLDFNTGNMSPIKWPAINAAAGYQFVDGPWERSWLPNEAMALVYRAHNAVPAGISLNALTFTPANAIDGSVSSGPIELRVNLTETPYTGIDIYHENQLIAHLNHSNIAQHVLYTPTETGIHTFIAVAAYQYNGQTHYTSKYATVGVASITNSVDGDFNHNGVVDAADYILWRKGSLPIYSQADYNVLRSNFGQVSGGNDFNHNGVFDAGDYVVWRKGSVPVYSNTDYITWRSHFGQPPGSGSAIGSASLVAVPEPATIPMVAFAMLLLVKHRQSGRAVQYPAAPLLRVALVAAGFEIVMLWNSGNPTNLPAPALVAGFFMRGERCGRNAEVEGFDHLPFHSVKDGVSPFCG